MNDITSRVVARIAMEFPSEHALKEYMHEHPAADPANHTVEHHEETTEPKKTESAKGFFAKNPAAKSHIREYTAARGYKSMNEFLRDPIKFVEKHGEDLADKYYDKAHDQDKQNDARWEGDPEDFGFEPPKEPKKAKSREILAFQDAILVSNVVARVLKAEEHVAVEFPTDEALQKYLKEHPKADKSKHKVKDQSHEEALEHYTKTGKPPPGWEVTMQGLRKDKEHDKAMKQYTQTGKAPAGWELTMQGLRKKGK